jgi:hypothetical protein
MGESHPICNVRAGPARSDRLHRGLLQPAACTFVHRVPVSLDVRKAPAGRMICCKSNRGRIGASSSEPGSYLPQPVMQFVQAKASVCARSTSASPRGCNHGSNRTIASESPDSRASATWRSIANRPVRCNSASRISSATGMLARMSGRDTPRRASIKETVPVINARSSNDRSPQALASNSSKRPRMAAVCMRGLTSR